MPLSTKLKADYTEMINQELERLVENNREFDSVREALENISNEGYKVPDALKERIFSVKDILYSPEDYVADTSSFSEYQDIIQGRINAKIAELKSYNEEQKSTYLQDQQQRLAKAAEYQQKVAGRQSPPEGSEAHVVTHEQMLAERQEQFIREADNFLEANEADNLILNVIRDVSERIVGMSAEDPLNIPLRTYRMAELHRVDPHDARILEDANYLLARTPDNIEALLGRAAYYQNNNNDDSAREDYARVLELDPGNQAALDWENGVNNGPPSPTLSF